MQTPFGSSCWTSPGMANFSSADFTFCNPSIFTCGNAYGTEFHASQNFSPISCTWPMTIQFPTPSIMSLTLICNTSTSSLPSSTDSSMAYPPGMTGLVCSSFASQEPMQPNPSEEYNFMLPTMVPELPPPYSSPYNALLNSTEYACPKKLQLHGKRKAVELVEFAPLPAKVRINEERMSACMSDLNLDNNNLGSHPDLEKECSWFSEDLPDSSDDMVTNLSQPTFRSITRRGLNENLRLHLCTELEMGFKTKEILPKVILEDLLKPCMQLVLWRPPGNSVVDAVKSYTKTTDGSDGSVDRSKSAIEETNANVVEVDMDEKVLTMSNVVDDWPSVTRSRINEASAVDLLSPPGAFDASLVDLARSTNPLDTFDDEMDL